MPFPVFHRVTRWTAGVLAAGSVLLLLPVSAAEAKLTTDASAFVTTIAKSNDFREETSRIYFEKGSSAPKSGYLTVDSDCIGQTMLGIGGAMTESAAFNIAKLSPAQQEEIYEAYYGESGAKYALTRSSIGSADFSTRSYSYDDAKKADPELTEFSIEKDLDYIIPAVKKIQQYNPEVKFFAAPWAPPAWMKKSGKRQGGIATAGISLVNNSVKPKYYQSYADYLVKYVQAYQQEGIDVYALSMQNEAQNNPQWECGTWSIEATTTFIGKYLGPTMEETGIDTQLLIWDWDKSQDIMHGDGFVKYNTRVLADETARKYIDGVAFHWYAGDLCHELKGIPKWSEDFDNLDRVKSKYPDIHLYATEACQEKGPWFGSYEPAYRYIHDILNDFEHGTECFIDWNLVLDRQGGPTQGVTNQCHAPIMLDENNKICYQPSYYVMKMISRAVQPNTVHIATDCDKNIDKTAVMDENGKISLLLGNTSSKAVSITVVDGEAQLKVELPAHSLTTVSYLKSDLCEHTFGEWATETEASCTKSGLLTRACTRCGLPETEKSPASGHIVVTEKAIPATNTTSGKTESKRCTVCSASVKASKSIPVISKVTLRKGTDQSYRLTSGKTASWKILSGSKAVSLKKDVITVKKTGTVKLQDKKSGKKVTITIK